MTYSETIEYLYGLEATRGWDLKLERVRAALDALGNPERRYATVLIAGTNGKGTTAALTHAALHAAGHRVGLYTSPHLVSFTERIRIGRQEISESDVVSGVERIRRIAPPEETGLTFFEVATLLALETFAHSQVDAAVLEVGLGGRLDATNVVEPACSAITTIGLDHQEYLGRTFAEIAREKAGVMRAARPVVLGPRLPAEALDAIHRRAEEVGARVVAAADVRGEVPLTAVVGARIEDDARVALCLLEELGRAHPALAVSAEARAAGFARARWPGRLEVIGTHPRLILDGAHNEESMAALCAELPRLAGGPARLVFGALSDKPWRELAAALRPHVCEVAVVPIRQRRGVDPAQLATAFSAFCPTRIGSDPHAEIARFASSDASVPIVATGSLFLVGEVYAGLLAKSGRLSIFEDAMAEVCA